jgi:hypothetical protein
LDGKDQLAICVSTDKSKILGSGCRTKDTIDVCGSGHRCSELDTNLIGS